MAEFQAAGQMAGYIGSTAGGQNVAATPTLVSAISSVDELNKRLETISQHAIKLAQAIGGPYPVGNDQPQTVGPPSAVANLCDKVSNAHRLASDISNAIDAMSRSLGIDGKAG